MYSLRRQLTVRFSLTMFIALAFIALWAVLGVRRTLRRQIDVALSGTLALQDARLAGGSRIPEQPSGFDAFRFFEDGSRIVVARNPGGGVVQASIVDLADFPLDSASFAAALHGNTTWTSEAWRGGQVRSVYAAAPRGSPPDVAVLQVVASLKPLADANRQLLFAMMGTVLLGTFAVGLGSYWLARSAVRPVIEMATQARTITPDAPGEVARITAHADVSEYQSLIEVLNGLLERSERAFNSQRRLTADLGHELRTPLTALRGEFEVALRSERTPRDYQSTLRSGLEEIDRLYRMCDALVMISRAHAGTLSLRRAPTDLNDLVLRALYTVRRTLEEREITVTTHLDYAGDAPLLDDQLAVRMMNELVGNAVKFSPQGGAIALGTAPHNGVLKVWVDDSGPGIAPEHLEHLFEPFFQADEARTRSEGTGLGLSMVASIAQAHGGSARAENLHGGGARFEIQLPIHHDDGNQTTPRS